MMDYRKCSNILRVHLKERKSLKTLILSSSSSSSLKEKKQLMGLLCSVTANESILRELISTTLHKEKDQMNYFLLMIIVHELLISKGGLLRSSGSGSGSSSGSFNRRNCRKEWELVLKYKQELKQEYKQIKSATTSTTTSTTSTNNNFKYVRVNFCKSTMEEVLEYFTEKKGYTLVDSLENDVGDGVATSTTTTTKTKNKLWIMKDQLLEDVLLFPKNTEFFNDLFYKEGKIVLQDKASCMPAHCIPYSKLFEEEQEQEQEHQHHSIDFIDACAAPGNKTSHLCSLIKNNNNNNNYNISKVFAFDRDVDRCRLLKEMMVKHVSLPDTIECMQMDFLQVDYNEEKYRNVRAILCDPSCSGSGIVSNGVGKGRREVDSKRLKSLHGFQVKILQHAFKFPSCEYVVYSTCSVYEEENESVVREVLKEQHGENQWEIVRVLDGWQRRGIGMEECVRCLPEEDGTHGFFVCMFRRKKNKKKKKEIVTVE